jgi:hypothetical protein
MAALARELATHAWLQATSGLGELIDYDFEGMSLDRFYQVSDQLWKENKFDIHNLEDSNFTQIYPRPLGKGVQSKMINKYEKI